MSDGDTRLDLVGFDYPMLIASVTVVAFCSRFVGLSVLHRHRQAHSTTTSTIVPEFISFREVRGLDKSLDLHMEYIWRSTSK